MKISPVQGMPAIANPSATGLSPDKLSRIKAIANNQTPEEVSPKEEPEVIELGQTPTSATQRIKMNVNQTVHRNGDMPAEPVAEAAPVAQTEPAAALSDIPIETKSVPSDTRPISPELAELAKERRALQVKERELLEKEKSLQAVPEGYIKLQDLQSNALATLQKHGVTYDQLTNEILGQKTQPDLSQFKEEILKSVEEKLAGKDTAQEEAVYAYMTQNVGKMANFPEYRLIRGTQSEAKVMDLVKRMWKEQGEILDEKEAMDLIEAELKEDAKRYSKLINGEEKPAEKQQVAPPVANEPRGITKTLTNKDSARPVINRRQRAIAAMLGQKI